MAFHEIHISDAATASDSAGTPLDQSHADLVLIADDVTAEVLDSEIRLLDTATAADSHRVRITIQGTGSWGWEAEALYATRAFVLSPLESDELWVDELYTRRMLIDGLLRICNPRGYDVLATLTWYPDPYSFDFEGPRVVLSERLLKSFLDFPLSISLQLGRYHLRIENRDSSRESPVHVLLTGWSARESQYPALFPAEAR